MDPRETPPESPAERQARQFAQLRLIGRCAEAIAVAASAAAIADIEDPPPEPSRPAHGVTFASAARILQGIIALELRVEGGPIVRRNLYRISPLTNDPRTILLRRALHDAVTGQPDRANRCREINRCLDEHLLVDPAALDAISETLDLLCRNLGITLDPARLSDELLDLVADPEGAEPDGADPDGADPDCAAPKPAS